MCRLLSIVILIFLPLRFAAGNDAVAPGADGAWELQSESNFAAEVPAIKERLAPWYTAEFLDNKNSNNDHLGLLLAAGTGRQHYLRLTERIPHSFRWELRLEMSWEGGFDRGWQFTEKGCYIGAGEFRKAGDDRITTDDPPSDMVIERDGEELRYFIDGNLKRTLKVSADDRSTIQAASERFGYLVVSARLYFKKGEKLSDPSEKKPVSAAAPIDIKWKQVYADDFKTAESLKRYYKFSSGELDWNEKYRGLLLKNTEEGGDVYAALHQSIPGDVRVRFRALRRKDAREVSIGVMFGLQGGLKRMDGYFAEWAEGTARLKKQGHLEVKVEAPTPETKERWVNLEVRKIGGHIEMLTEGKPVLAWDDPHPIQSAEHDLMSFYVWSEQTIITDLVIERNAADKIEPLKDDPATEDNIVNSRRDGKESNADF
jgi:hypothetical protein